MGYEIHPANRIEVSTDPKIRAEAFKVANKALAVSLGVTGAVGAVLFTLLKLGYEEKKEMEEAKRREALAAESAPPPVAVAPPAPPPQSQLPTTKSRWRFW
jgi:hypothetical protein